ncbi:hypothetical protein HYT45_02795 [Candidatus Uhrbacteria bacterium]|nr:hypothetical protein [Candidatus Uhrbacteria bacterium]
MTKRERVLLTICGLAVGVGAMRISLGLGLSDIAVLTVGALVAAIATTAFFLLYHKFNPTP